MPDHVREQHWVDSFEPVAKLHPCRLERVLSFGFIVNEDVQFVRQAKVRSRRFPEQFALLDVGSRLKVLTEQVPQDTGEDLLRS